MLSIIIPTHDPRFLAEAIESVLNQTLQDFEIVVVPNGETSLPPVCTSDPRIKVVKFYGQRLIGAIKNFAFMHGSGEILVELDHDDILAPDALAEIAEAFEHGVDFVYSNFAEFIDGSDVSSTYDASMGWKTRDVEVLGRRMKETVAFEPSPASMSRIFFAPAHVRAWSREFYRKIGGHDTTLGVCDDHDTLVRTYLAGKMVHIDKCLYLYRLHEGNTIKATQEQIIQTTWQLYSKYIEALVIRWADQKGLPYYDVGAGPHGKWHPFALVGALQNDSVGAFRAVDYLNFQPDKMQILGDLYRKLAPGGWLLSNTPSAMGNGAHMDPRVRSYWTKPSFYYVTDRHFAKELGNNMVRFQTQRLVEYYPSNWHKEEHIHYVAFDGIALKDGYEGPGPRTI